MPALAPYRELLGDANGQLRTAWGRSWAAAANLSSYTLTWYTLTWSFRPSGCWS